MKPLSEQTISRTLKSLSLLAIFTAAFFLITSCKKTVAVTGVRLDKTSLTLTEGETANLTATVEPANAANGAVSWSSSDINVASVNGGTVKALKAGSTTIKVTTADGGKTATCSVTVKSSKISVTGVTLDKTTLTMTEGETASLKATVAPANATDQSVTWTSSEKGVATVDSNGGLIAIKEGSSIITVTTKDGNFNANCILTVKSAKVNVTGVTLDKTSASLVVNQTLQLKATVAPDNATDKSVSWSSSDPNKATVDKNGLVTAKAAGSVTITVVTTDASKMATCDITITQPVTGVALDKSTLTITEGETASLTATVSPTDASDKTITWSSSDTKIATVDQTGKVTAVKEGSAKVTVTTKDGGKTADCAVTVKSSKISVTGVTLDKTSASLVVNQTLQLKATVAPDNATDKSVSWTSSDPNKATVDKNGLVTAKAAGSVTITVVTTDASKMATCDITITQPVTGVALDKSTLTLIEGETASLTATVSPADASDKTISWKSSDEKIATVDQTGKITAIKEGSAKITVTTKDGGKTADCAVTVKSAKISVTGVTLDKSTLTLTEGESASLTATVSPADATDKTITWSSSDTKIATVDQTGRVAAVKEGSAKVTVTTKDGGKTATCSVIVKSSKISVTGVTLDKTSASLVVNQTLQLKATVAPDNATDKSVSWTSSDPNKATVDKNGLVTAKAAGSVTITVVTTDASKMATCDITITQPVSGVALDKTSLTLTEGESASLTATVSPADASDKTITWSSSDTKIATVDQTGKVTAVKEGSAKITVTTKDGGKTADCAVTVKSAKISVTGVTLDKTTLTLTEGETASLTATVSPADASDKTITWSSSDTKIATVDQTGKVTAVKEGSAKITVTTKDGGKTADCAVTVMTSKIGVTGVTLDKTSASLVVNQTLQLKATVTPDNATDKSVSWTSSDPNKATVDKNGLVTAKAAGSVTITVVTTDASKMATCDITITQPVSGVTLDKSTLTLTEGETASLTATVSPADASDKTITWSSSDTKIATVDQTGKVTAVKEGSAKITVTTKDGGKTADCAVTVMTSKIGVTGVTLDKTSATLVVNQTLQLTATVAPDNATDKSVSWSSSNSGIASVSSTGLVTAVAAGNATITATANDGSGKMGTCDVKVTELGISIPDAAMKKYLVDNYDTNGDGEISVAEAAAVTSALDLSDKGIENISGLEYFINITGLDLRDNFIGGTVDFSKNTKLTKIQLNNNSFTSIDVSKCTALTYLDCNGNELKELHLEANTLLEYLNCGANAISTLDLTKNTKLTELSCYGNHLSVLDLTKNTALTKAYVGKQTDASSNFQYITVTKGSLPDSIFPDLNTDSNSVNYMVKFNIPATGIKVYPTSLYMIEGQTSKLTATLTPSNATSAVTWDYSSSYFTSTTPGTFTAKELTVAEAYPTITATVADNTSLKSACNVTIYKMSFVDKDNPSKNITNVNISAGDVVKVAFKAGDGYAATNEIISLTEFSVVNSSNAVTIGKKFDGSIPIIEVTGANVGTSTLTVTIGSVSRSFTVTVSQQLATSITTTPSKIDMIEGMTRSFTATLSPAGSTGTLVWKTDPCATNNGNGSFTANAISSEYYTGYNVGPYLKENSSVSGNAVLTVYKLRPVLLSSPKTLLASLTLDVNTQETAQVGFALAKSYYEATLAGTDILTTSDFTVSSSNSAVVVVTKLNNSYGGVSYPGILLTAQGAGTATITVIFGAVSATFTVTCPVRATGISISPSSFTGIEGQQKTFTATISPSNATQTEVTWSTSTNLTYVSGQDTKKAVFELKELSSGNSASATVYADVKDNTSITTSISGTIYKMRFLDFNHPNNEILTTSTLNIDMTKTPFYIMGFAGDSGTGNLATTSMIDTPEYSLTSSNTSVVTVNSQINNDRPEIVLNPVAPGTATIYVTIGSVKRMINVNITASIKSISINKASYSAYEGQYIDMSYSYTPANASESINWDSSNTAVANNFSNRSSLAGSGAERVNAVGAGSANIHSISASGGASDYCTVTVSPIYFNYEGSGASTATSATVATGKSIDLSLVDGGDGSHTDPRLYSDLYAAYEWSSSNTNVITVTNSTGTGSNPITATVTAVGGATASAFVYLKLNGGVVTKAFKVTLK